MKALVNAKAEGIRDSKGRLIADLTLLGEAVIFPLRSLKVFLRVRASPRYSSNVSAWGSRGTKPTVTEPHSILRIGQHAGDRISADGRGSRRSQPQAAQEPVVL